MRLSSVIDPPPLPLLTVKNTRKAFFEPEEFQAILRHLPSHLPPVMTAAHLMGWRAQSELLASLGSKCTFR